MTPGVDAPVLIVGAGPTGLATAIGLARMGVRSIVIERHPGTSIHPKARGVNVRTMEIFRQWGIAAAVRDAGLSPEANGFFFRGPSLLAPTFERFGGGGLSADAEALSPETWMVISQDVLEPVLLEAARAGGADVRFGHELVAIAAGDGSPLGEPPDGRPDGVEATIRNRATGETATLRARWVVGADGADSHVRALAGIDLVGHGPLVDNVSILFEAPLGDRIDDRRSAVYYLTDNPTARPRGHPMSVGNPPDDGVLLTVDNADRWLLVIGGDVASIDDREAARRVARAIGSDDIPIRILGMLAWSPAARVAARYRQGPLFVAGDAAHQMTPSGAFGLNVGIGDAHNLAWKLGAVEAGWAGPSLLDTYDAERRPVGTFATDQSHQQFLGTRPAKPFGNWGVILGARYASPAIVPDGSDPAPLADPAVDYVPEAHPGARAPHAWLESNGERRSTLDLYGAGFVLLAAADGEAWVSAAAEGAGAVSARDVAVPLTTFQVGRDGQPADQAAFDAVHGIGRQGAVLVRPDGHVAWRSAGAAGTAAEDGSRASAALPTILRQVTGAERP